MAQNIFAKTKHAGIFKDERILYPEYIPERLPFRDPQIDELVHSFKPATEGKKPLHVFVTGPSGSGKSVTVKYVLNELSEFTDRAKSLYINCWQLNTRHAILAEITNFLGHAVPRRGIATDELYSRFLQVARQIKFIPLLILDEFDQLFCTDDASRILYDLLRISERQKNYVGLVLVSNDEEAISKLDSRVKSSLAADQVKFPAYSPQELKSILNSRAEYAFQQNVLDPEVLNVASAHAAKLGGDCRIGMEALLKAGRLAEKEGSSKITLEHLKNAFKTADEYGLKNRLKYLTKDEKKLLFLIAKSASIESGDLFEAFVKTKPLAASDRSYRNFITRLQTMNLIETESVSLEKGRSRIIKPNFSPDLSAIIEKDIK